MSKGNLLLPTEIWTEVFQHVPFHDLQSATLTCRGLRSISQPRIFEKVTLQPYFVEHDLERSALSDMDAAKELKKLRFFTSASISAYVRKCSVNARYRDRPKDYEEPDDASIDSIFDAIFQLLPRLSQVQKLEFVGITFTPVAISQLSLLLNIPSLTISTCHLPPVTTSFPVINAEALNYDYQGPAMDIFNSQGGAESWMHLFKPERLKVVNIGSFHAVTGRILRDFMTFPLFPNLQTLSVTLHQDVLLPVFYVLSRLPSLHRLILNTVGRSSTADQCLAMADRIHHMTLPSVQQYKGPYELLRRFQNDKMTSLSLSGFGGISEGDDPEKLIKELNSFKHNLRNVDYFEARTSDHLSKSFLLAIFSLIPGVKSLHLATTSGNESSALLKCFVTLLTIDLPTDLTHLHLWWPPNCEIEDATMSSKLFVIQLLKRQPSLQSVLLAHSSLNLEYHAAKGRLTGEFKEESFYGHAFKFAHLFPGGS
ncbi:hypothetical protein H0H87_011891 [Tephrocybe sp. NHM501043]|nr:hypothetical protein H0H87_011891 [Tephrocybe sp. NHM501043]